MKLPERMIELMVWCFLLNFAQAFHNLGLPNPFDMLGQDAPGAAAARAAADAASSAAAGPQHNTNGVSFYEGDGMNGVAISSSSGSGSHGGGAVAAFSTPNGAGNNVSTIMMSSRGDSPHAVGAATHQVNGSPPVISTFSLPSAPSGQSGQSGQNGQTGQNDPSAPQRATYFYYRR